MAGRELRLGFPTWWEENQTTGTQGMSCPGGDQPGLALPGHSKAGSSLEMMSRRFPVPASLPRTACPAL